MWMTSKRVKTFTTGVEFIDLIKDSSHISKNIFIEQNGRYGGLW